MKKLRVSILLVALFVLLCACKDDKKESATSSDMSVESSASAELSSAETAASEETVLSGISSEGSEVSSEDSAAASVEQPSSELTAESTEASADMSSVAPPTDSSAVTTPKDDSSITPPKDDSSVANSKDDSSVAPPKDDSSIIPPKDDSSVAPPNDDSSVTPPKDDSSVAPPKDDSSVAPPSDDSSVVPPKDDSSVAPPTESSADDSSATTYEGTVITTAGTHTLTGNVECPVIIDALDERITLVLNNATLKASDSPAIYVVNAKKVEIQLVGTNVASDGKVYSDAYALTAKAAVFSEDSLVFSGSGNFTVTGNFKHAIACDDDIVMNGGIITVASAVTDGVHVNDSFEINGGKLTVKSAGSDGIQSEQLVVINGGGLDLTATANGIKADNNLELLCDITINGGTVKINSTNDAIRCKDTINILGGTTNITTGSDGIQADGKILIDGGAVTAKCTKDGIKGKVVTMLDGDVSITAEDDGVNASDPLSTVVGVEVGVSLTVSGGNLYVDAGGDGLDSNGTLTISGGVVAIDGPTSGLDSMIDVEGTQLINGGVIFACNSGEMLDTPTTADKQCVAIVSGLSLKAGTSIAIADSNGKTVLCYKLKKNVGAITVSAPELISGGSYTLYSGVTIKGTASAGSLYHGSGVSFTGGTAVKTFKQSNIITTVN